MARHEMQLVKCSSHNAAEQSIADYGVFNIWWLVVVVGFGANDSTH